jgi:sugar lactone lactonase YvrE
MPTRNRPSFARFAAAAHTLRFTVAGIASAAALLLTACANAPTNPISPIVPAKAGITGVMHGGQQAVSGATIQLWAIGTAGNGSPSTPLLNPAVTTDANGNFNITGLYTCPTASTLVYLTGTGGNPGLTSGTNNSALAMMAVLGSCGSLGSSTYVTMNEITTIGSIFALGSYASSYSSIGYNASTPSNIAGIAADFSLASADYVNIATGTAGGPSLPSGYGVSAPLINTLANVLATCINTSGSTSTGTPCTNLFALAGGASTTDTVAAAIYIANHPTANLTALASLASPSSPFQPQLKAAPSTWTITIEPVVATPTISPNGGTYTSSQTVTLADTTTNATIHYTLDGTTPTSSSPTYSTALTVSTTETINAIATLSGDLDSAIASASFTINFPSTSGIITTVAGNGISGFSGDGGQATSAELFGPSGIALDSGGNIYFIDYAGARVRKITLAGVISTVAGNGIDRFSGDGGQATNASLYAAGCIATDSSGNLYIGGVDRVRKVTPAGIISTVAGNGIVGFSGDGGQATSASLNYPSGLAVDTSGNLYIADHYNSRVRKVTPAGVISTFAGNGTNGHAGDGGQAALASVSGPLGLAFDSNGNLYVSHDYYVRKVTPLGVISTVAGGANGGFSGDGGPASSAGLQSPSGIAFDSYNNLYIVDGDNHRIRMVNAAGVISTVAGNGTWGFSGDGGQATNAQFGFDISNIAADSNGNTYIVDPDNYRIRRVSH